MSAHITIEIDDPTPAQAAAIAQALGAPAGTTGGGTSTGGTGTTGGTASGGTTGGTTPPVPTAKNYFPADPGTAPFPSPEGSMLQLTNGKVYLYDSSTDTSVQRDDAYLRDVDGKIIAFKMPLDLVPSVYDASSMVPVVLVNGAQPVSWFSGDQVAISGGIAWVHTSGKWFFISPATAGSGGNLSTLTYQPAKGKQYVPTPATSAGPAMPSAPAASVPAPGSGKVINAGPSQTIKTLKDAIDAAQPGDTIALDPAATFAESVSINKPLKITGGGIVANPGTVGASFSGGAKIDGTSLNDVYAQGKGGLVPSVDVIIEGLEITGFGLTESVGGGTAAIRPADAMNLVVRNCHIHDNQDGIFSGGFDVTIDVENTILRHNGIGDGQTHNVYVAQAVKSSFTNVTSDNPNGGHALKSRANVTTVNGGYFYAGDASPVEMPDGSTQLCTIMQATIEKKAGDANHNVLGYAVESQRYGAAGAAVIGCNVITNCDGPFVQCLAGSVAFSGCTFSGANKPTANGAGTITGLPA